MPLRDDMLTTETEIRDRMRSIARQRDALCQPRVRAETITAFRNRQAKIAKLTEREDALRFKLKAALRAAN